MVRRVTLGLVLAGLVGALGAWWLAKAAVTVQNRGMHTRSSVAHLLMLAETAGVFLNGEADVQPLTAAFEEEHPEISSIRIVSGRDLVASTAPGDTGENAAPRRLQREEKDLFDLARALQASVNNNLDPSAPRQEEISTASLPSGGLQVAVPVEFDGENLGMASAEIAPPAPPRAPPMLGGLLVLLVPTLIYWGVSRFLPQNRWVHAGAAVALLLVALMVFAGIEWNHLADAREGLFTELASQVVEDASWSTARQLEATLDPVAPQPETWDVNDLRQPLGVILTGGEVDAAAVSAELDSGRRAYNRGLWLVQGIAILLCLAFAVGWAASLWRTLKAYKEAYAYTVPALLGMLVLVFIPFVYGILISFTNLNIYNSDEAVWNIWVGFDNYTAILTDFEVFETTDAGRTINYQNFYWTLGFTIIWTITNVTIGVSLGLLLALILNTKGLRGKAFYRLFLILPWAVPNYITALIWKGMFHQQFGVINQVIQMFGGTPVAWFETPLSSFATILTTNGWLSFPFMMVISLGALQSIPSDLYEAARVDGATRWRQFTAITLPSLKPALIPAIILSVVWTFNQFNIPYLVSQGEPAGATEILITDAYKIAFEQYRKGYAAAYSVIIFIILMGYGIWQNKVTKATEGI
jgi:arabinogalactan oligomer/maltooligosaccharide transport system permease protein